MYHIFNQISLIVGHLPFLMSRSDHTFLVFKYLYHAHEAISVLIGFPYFSCFRLFIHL